MPYIANYPLAMVILAFAVLWLSARLGTVLRKRKPLDPEAREDFSVLQAAALTLLALLIGFGFSAASSRYDQRKNLEEAEANAIGTEYVRAALLPSADATKVRRTLKAYLEQRIVFYMERDEDALQQVNARTAELQTALWEAVLGPVAAQPTPVMALVLAGMNDVLNAQGYTQAAWWNRYPGTAWGLLFVVAICANLMIGYSSRGAKPGARLLLVFPILVSIAIGFIADIDAPRRGIIRINPQNLAALLQSLPAE